MLPFRKWSARILNILSRLRPDSPREPGHGFDSVLQEVNRKCDELRASDSAQLKSAAQDLRRRTWSDSMVPEAFALAAVQAERLLGIRMFDVQLLGALVMADGKVAEMQTGEGKTLAAVPVVYALTLACGGVHVLTANDYLAKRDALWMGDIYKSLGFSVGYIVQQMTAAERRKAYACDIVYATPNEVGFDFLRDQLCLDPGELVHQPFRSALFDEVDSILIDEARIPLVIAGGDITPQDLAYRCAAIARTLRLHVDYSVDEYARNILLMDSGAAKAEEALQCGNLYDLRNAQLLTAILDALHAQTLLRRDIDYIVRNNAIELVDEFKGRIAENRRWAAGLQSAVEAKENLALNKQGRILGSITLENLAGLYPRICGMTGTAATQAEEFFKIYRLEVVVIPTNRPVIRVDEKDMLFRTKAEKEQALLAEIVQVHGTGRPILVGTASVAESEQLSTRLRQARMPHNVLNARNHETEARIVAQAGALGAVTISTNMAGRGTDIPLGGTSARERQRVLELGGLYVIGTNRHENRRIDHQLRGRSGRQGDPGLSRFFISLEDDLMERFGIREALTDRMPEAEAIEHVQRVIEGQNLEIRKTLRKYEQIIEAQRRIVHARRREVLTGAAESVLETNAPELFERMCQRVGRERLAELEVRLTLLEIDEAWSLYLADIAELRSGIHWVSLGGKDPLNEYLHQSALAFENMLEDLDSRVIAAFSELQPGKQGEWDGLSKFDRGATWTYVINDRPFGDFGERLAKALVQNIRQMLQSRPFIGT
jgi:preprotein translocase subunit SecA